MAHTPILLFGATGRMGRAIRSCLPEFPDVSLRVCVAPTPPGEGPEGCTWMEPGALDGGAKRLPSDLVVIDVSVAPGTERLLEWLERSPRAFVSATTGLSDGVEKRIEALGERAAVLRARNLSVGNAAALAMLRSLAPEAKSLFEIDVLEHHHSAKRDAPSGTALQWAAALAERPDRARFEAPATERREPGEIRIHSIRSGMAVGTHRALFAGAGETLEVVHTVSDRAVFARGALRAARFLHGKPPGGYTIEHVLVSP